MPTDSMVERVAEVMRRTRPNLDDESRYVLARAAIAAMREPTTEMKWCGAPFCGGAMCAYKAWLAMIDAALDDAPKDKP